MAISRYWRGAFSYLGAIRLLNRNVRLLLLATSLSSLAEGIFGVDLNLYVLSLGALPDALGNILSAGPFAHALASIPVGFLGELFGFRKTFFAIYLLAGLSRLSQVASADVGIIALGAFAAGLALSGDFVVRLPFLAANSQDAHRAHIFSLSSVLSSIFFAFGSLVAGYLPNVFSGFGADLATSYRYTLYCAGLLLVVSSLPALLIRDGIRRPRNKLSLYPYLWGIDPFTVRVAIIELFVGLSMGLVSPFMNVFYLFRLGTSREFFSNVSALALFPAMFATVLAPYLAKRWGTLRTVSAVRLLIPVASLAMAATTNAYLGTAAYWLFRALFLMSQSVWFVFVMDTASPRNRTAASSWLEISFWLGTGIAAQVTGRFLAQANYTLPFYASALAALASGLLTYWSMRYHLRRRLPGAASS